VDRKELCIRQEARIEKLSNKECLSDKEIVELCDDCTKLMEKIMEIEKAI